MASPQPENGFIRIANELWDEVIRRDFSKRQKDILLFIWRLSYGCQKKADYIPKLVYFELCGIRRNHIKEELEYLESCRVIFWNREEKLFEVNKDYDQWIVSPVKGWQQFKFDELLHLNMQKSSQNGNKNVPETGTKKFPKQELFEEEEIEKFPKQELSSSQNGNIFSKKVPEKGTSTPENPLQDADSGVSKDIFKDSIKDSSSTSNKDTTSNTGPTTAAASAAEDFSFGRIYRIFEEHFTINGKITALEAEDLSDLYDTYGGEWLLKAMREAVRHNVRTLAYLSGILNGYRQRGGPDKDQRQATGPPETLLAVPSADDTREHLSEFERLRKAKQEMLRKRAEEQIAHGT